jgi:hypothetical protein
MSSELKSTSAAEAHHRGRPRCAVKGYRLETMLPAAALDELKRREEQTGVYRTRICAAILCRELIESSANVRTTATVERDHKLHKAYSGQEDPY